MVLIPSLYAHILSGVVLAVGVVYLVLNMTKIVSRDPYQIVLLLLLFSIALGVHGLSHANLESAYNYNPLALLLNK
jgi:hypothetical protein